MKKSKPESNFLPVPHALIEEYIKPLGNAAFVVFLILFQLAHRFGDKFYHSDKQICDKYKISLSMLRRGRVRLRSKGFIVYKSGTNLRARATIYKVLPGEFLRKQFRMVKVSRTDREGVQND